MLSVAEAQDKAEKLVAEARAAGADAADAIYVGERSSGVQVRKGALEDVHRSEGEEIGLRVFLGTRSASVASSSAALLRSSVPCAARRRMQVARLRDVDRGAAGSPSPRRRTSRCRILSRRRRR